MTREILSTRVEPIGVWLA